MLPGAHRETARVLLTNRKREIFLLLTHFDPEVGLPPRWITPGGGIDAGETPLEAAARELREETGLAVSQSDLGQPIWITEGRWNWPDGNFHTYKDFFFQLEVDDFVLDQSGWTNDELRDVLEYRWWKLTDLLQSSESVGPHGLAEFLRNHFS
ncbi:MAG: NUDIX hydrolase [Microbacteriaceae bacterium]